MENPKPGYSISRRRFIGSLLAATTVTALASSCNRPAWQIGCFTRPWAKHDYRTGLDEIAGAGFKYAGLMSSDKGLLITLSTTPEEAAIIGEEAKARGLEIASIYGGAYNVRNSVDEGIAGLTRLIDNSASCGCPTLLLGGIAAPELADAYYKVIAECCDYAEEKRVGIVIKPHGGTNATGPECRMHIEKIGHKNFNLWYDPGNIFWYSDGALDPIDDSAEVDGLVTGMCVKDFKLPKAVDITPGTGMVDFPGVFERLRSGGFRGGPLIVECLAPGDIDSTHTEAVKARQFLEELTA